VVPELIKQYVDTGKARFVYREFPLTSIHPNAQKASEAAVCAGRQGKFWEMNEHLFATVGEWGAEGVDPVPFLKSYAGEFGLDEGDFASCLDSGDAATEVQGDMLAGQALGVNATPYFFINDIPIRGGLPVESLGRIIDFVAAGGEVPPIEPVAGDWHARGNPQAAAKMVAFVDYGSAESAQHANDVLPQLVDAYIDTGLLTYILHPFVNEVGGAGEEAGKAAECASEQGKGWEMHSQLFAAQDAWVGEAAPLDLFVGYAEDLDLDAGAFETCMDSDWATLRVHGGAVVGTMYGVPGAPVFLYNNGQGQQGSPTYEEIAAQIDSILNQ
jgi:protein-disulfide isomerase